LTYKNLSSVKTRRTLRKGEFFALIRIFGFLLIGTGVLVFIVSLIGFFILLISGAPTLIDAIVHSESYFSGFIIILYLVALIAPLVVIFFGLILAGSGTMLYYWTTEPVSINQIRGAVNLEYKNNEYNNGIKP